MLLGLQIFLFAAVVPVLLRLRLRQLAILLEPKPAPSSPEPRKVQRVVRYTDLVLKLGRPLVRRVCLTRSVTLCYFLRRAGLDVTLCFGVGTLGDAFVGHSWLAKDGEPFLEASDPRPLFTVVYTIPAET